MGKNKQKNVTFSQLMNAVDESVKTKNTQIIPEKKETPVSNTEQSTTDQSTQSTEKNETQKVIEKLKNMTVGTDLTTGGMTLQNDKDGIPVAKPSHPNTQFVTPAVKYAESSHAIDPKDKVESPDAQRVAVLIQDYLDYNNGNIMRSESDKLVAGRKFRDILFFGLNHPTPDVLDHIYKFFVKNKDRILAPEIALPNTLSFDKVTCERINCLYTLFRSLTEEQPFRLNVANTRLLLKSVDTNKVDALLMYFDNKQKQ